ncbi:hypothetical protein E2C01_060924 [Portunus trituberculatus]|uniref:Uncharacterized protein n=1 Tax=Portunus trituberculatus TaxID=210409 RepID=A0A5B7H2H9_PORTR|nr:hypothetical protein [Portunus trituberculatus]
MATQKNHLYRVPKSAPYSTPQLPFLFFLLLFCCLSALLVLHHLLLFHHHLLLYRLSALHHCLLLQFGKELLSHPCYHLFLPPDAPPQWLALRHHNSLALTRGRAVLYKKSLIPSCVCAS